MENCKIIDLTNYKIMQKNNNKQKVENIDSKEILQKKLDQLIGNLKVYISALEEKIKNQKK